MHASFDGMGSFAGCDGSGFRGDASNFPSDMIFSKGPGLAAGWGFFMPMPNDKPRSQVRGVAE